MATPTNLPSTFVTGQVFTAAQANALRGAFRILQVVQGSASVQVGSTSTTWADTGLSATITPSSTSSLILVMYSQNLYTQGTATGMGLRLVRQIPSPNTVMRTDADLSYGTNSGVLVQQTFFYLDSPNTTSALTYKTQFNRSIGSATVYVQANGANQQGNILLFEISA